MANVIKHKRGSGSDPVASDLVVGEVAIRTDVGKLFTKMDNGSVAEIAGGGSDIAINTLSSSSATGGGSATFNGSAYRFTLSAPPSVSAQQLLVSINGVIQKPVAGTGQPSEGFSVDGTDIILGDAPATGSDFFILTFKSLGVSEPADNSVTSAKIVDGTIVNADINASAAIAGTKVSPDFGSQAITTTGVVTSGTELIISGTEPRLTFVDTNNNPDFQIWANAQKFQIYDSTNSQTRLLINSSGNVGIGTTSPVSKLHVANDDSFAAKFGGSGGGSDYFIEIGQLGNDSSAGFNATGLSGSMLFQIGGSEKMRINSSGNLGIGTTSPASNLHIESSAPELRLSDTNNSSAFCRFDGNGANLNIHADKGNTVSNTTMGFGIDNSIKMLINSSGRVGIGTTSPSDKLVVSAANSQLRLIDSDDSKFVQFSYSGGKLITRNNSTSTTTAQFTLDESGRLGIGTISPSVTLDIEATTPTIRLTDSDASGTPESEIRGGGGDLVLSADRDNEKSDTVIGFNIDGSEKMRIDSSGNTKFNSGFGSVTTVYGCRAWIQLNQTGSQSITGSGGVSSISDGGTGNTTINFTTAMPDDNYAIVGGAQQSGAGSGVNFGFSLCIQSYNTTNAIFIYRPSASSDTKEDNSKISIAFFR